MGAAVGEAAAWLADAIDAATAAASAIVVAPIHTGDPCSAAASDGGTTAWRPTRIMGDLWPRSVLVEGAAAAAVASPSAAAHRGSLWLIDWEMSGAGDAAQDAGHFIAHAAAHALAAPTPTHAALWRAVLRSFAMGYAASGAGGTAAWADVPRRLRVARTHAACELVARLTTFRAGSMFEHSGTGQRATAVLAAAMLAGGECQRLSRRRHDRGDAATAAVTAADTSATLAAATAVVGEVEAALSALLRPVAAGEVASAAAIEG